MVKPFVRAKVATSEINNLLWLYLLGFLFAFHTALPVYINSSFLNAFISEKALGIVYSLASLLTVLLFFLAPFILRKFGNYRVTVSLVILEMLALVGLIFEPNGFYVVFSFISSLIVIPFLYFSLDIFLEGFSQNIVTGKIRGIYLTLANLAWVFSPFISGLILNNKDYWKIYLVSLVFLVPILLILVGRLRHFKDSEYQATSISLTIMEVWKNKNIKNIFMAKFLLDFFYAWMTIYTPIYLHKYIGFSWTEIGFIFGVMLLPFIFIQFPLGKIADEKYGEKEILSVGFIVIAISTGALFFVPNDSSLWLWAIILFITRIGAAGVEIMCDTYFFKKVSNLNVNIIGFFRMSRPLAYMLGPVIATLALGLFGGSNRSLFLILGVIMLFGLWFSLRLKDTK